VRRQGQGFGTRSRPAYDGAAKFPHLAAGVLLLPVLWLGLRQRDEQLHWLQEPTLGSLHHFPGEVVGSEPGGWFLVGLAFIAVSCLDHGR
jgi:hypothetical protein